MHSVDVGGSMRILVACVLLALLAPTVGAVDAGCVDAPAGEAARIVALPLLGWTPTCVTTDAALGVVFTNLEAVARGITFDTCEGASTPRLGPTDEWAASFAYDAGRDALFHVMGGEAFPCARVTSVPEHDVTVPWHDTIHGPSVGGLILVRTH